MPGERQGMGDATGARSGPLAKIAGSTPHILRPTLSPLSGVTDQFLRLPGSPLRFERRDLFRTRFNDSLTAQIEVIDKRV